MTTRAEGRRKRDGNFRACALRVGRCSFASSLPEFCWDGTSSQVLALGPAHYRAAESCAKLGQALLIFSVGNRIFRSKRGKEPQEKKRLGPVRRSSFQSRLPPSAFYCELLYRSNNCLHVVISIKKFCCPLRERDAILMDFFA